MHADDHKLAYLEDVDTTGLADGDALVWDATAEKYVPGTAGSGSGVSDHGALLGRDDDDHPQYLRGTDGGKGTINVVASSSATLTLDLADGNDHDVTLDADCTITLAGATAGFACYSTILLRQDATGSRLVTWPASIEWVGDVEPTLQTAASAWDAVGLFTYDGGTTWFGTHGQSGGGTPPSTDRAWMPLTTVVGGVPELVWDADNSLIPTEVPI